MRILGLDIGTTSIGFALVDFDKSRHAGSILRLGVRIFPEARDPDGTPLNQQRRAKRMMRRQLRRRRERRRSLNELLASSDLLPAYGGDQWREVMKLDPYALRAKGLSEPLSPHELGRALYHLSKRRHFKERDLAEIGESETAPESEETRPAKPRGKAKAAPKDGEPNDEAKSTEARKHFVAELKPRGKRLGQTLAARATDAKRRGEHATRAIVEEEFSPPRRRAKGSSRSVARRVVRRRRRGGDLRAAPRVLAQIDAGELPLHAGASRCARKAPGFASSAACWRRSTISPSPAATRGRLTMKNATQFWRR